MTLFASILLDNILPTFLAMGGGVLLDRQLHIDKKSLSRMALYLLTPCFIFTSITQSDVEPARFGNLLIYIALLTVAMVVLGLLIGRLLRWPGRLVDALVLSVAFVNAGNFGLSVVLFSYGEVGLELATVAFVASNFACNSVAAFFAARSRGGQKRALLKMLKLPGLYAFLLALVFRALEWTVPQLLLKPVSLIGRASVPIMLMMLGVQLSQTRLGRRYREVAVGVFVRLVVGTLVAVVLAPVVGLEGLARKVAIVEGSTPTAVSSSLMAVEFDADAEYVTSVVFFSTLLSSISLAVLMWFLK